MYRIESINSQIHQLGTKFFLPLGIVSCYNQIVTNVGNHFDGYMGKFFAPHSGAYEFWIDGKVGAAKHGVAQLRINGEAIKNFGAGEIIGDDHVTITGNSVVSLSAYDEVEIFILNTHDTSNDEAILGYGLEYFMFAGRSL